MALLQCGVFVLLMVSGLQLKSVNGVSKVPCFFIFGDSLVDNGNNNGLETSARVNYQPYGIDFPQGPTGRFTNGQTTVDFLAQRLGFDNFIQPYATANESEIFYGVNYASGAAGILDETGQGAGMHISLNRQLQNHQHVTSIITNKIGNRVKAANYLNQCLYSIGVGSNDYINNYFQPSYNTSKRYNISQYTEILAGLYSYKLKTLYDFGARKIAVNGLGEIGCTPFARLLNLGNGSCFDEGNFAARHFNYRLKVVVDNFLVSHPDVKILFISNQKLPLPFPGAIEDRSCCLINDYGLCRPLVPVCPNRDLYMYWDGFHPTEIVNKNKATTAYRLIEKYLL